MRPLELLLLVGLAFASVSLLAPASKRAHWTRLLPFGALTLACLQLWIEGYRWQLVPAYLLVTAFALSALVRLRSATRPVPRPTRPGRGWVRLVVACVVSIWLIVGAALPVLFPQFELPQPSGPYAVGLTDLFLVDASRAEPFTTDPDDHREVSTRIWYPAQVPADAQPVRYGEHAREIGRILTRGSLVPPFILDSQVMIESHSYRDASLAPGEERFPVLIFSHGYWAGLSQSTVLMEDLASHGYVAVSVAHAFETPFFISREGEIRAFDPQNDEFRLRGAERAHALGLQQQIVETYDRRKLEELFRKIADARPKMIESLRLWSEDVRFVFDELERLDRGKGRFGARLDLEQIGVLGHSFGGATAHQVCVTDLRCKAGVNLDGVRFGDVRDGALTRPFLFVHHDNPHATHKTPNRVFFDSSRQPVYLVLVRGTRHLSFSDLSLYGRGSLIRLLGVVGSINGKRCLRIQNDYVRSFFDKHLRGRDNGLLDGPSTDYPEVTIQVATDSWESQGDV